MQGDEQGECGLAVADVAHRGLARVLRVRVVQQVVFHLKHQAQFESVGAEGRLGTHAGTGGDCAGLGARGKEGGGFLLDYLEIVALAYPHTAVGVQLQHFAFGQGLTYLGDDVEELQVP